MKDTISFCFDECEGSTSSYAFCCPSYNGAQPEDPDCERKITRLEGKQHKKSIRRKLFSLHFLELCMSPVNRSGTVADSSGSPWPAKQKLIGTSVLSEDIGKITCPYRNCRTKRKAAIGPGLIHVR